MRGGKALNPNEYRLGELCPLCGAPIHDAGQSHYSYCSNSYCENNPHSTPEERGTASRTRSS